MKIAICYGLFFGVFTLSHLGAHASSELDRRAFESNHGKMKAKVNFLMRERQNLWDALTQRNGQMQEDSAELKANLEKGLQFFGRVQEQLGVLDQSSLKDEEILFRTSNLFRDLLNQRYQYVLKSLEFFRLREDRSPEEYLREEKSESQDVPLFEKREVREIESLLLNLAEGKLYSRAYLTEEERIRLDSDSYLGPLLSGENSTRLDVEYSIYCLPEPKFVKTIIEGLRRANEHLRTARESDAKLRAAIEERLLKRGKPPKVDGYQINAIIDVMKDPNNRKGFLNYVKERPHIADCLEKFNSLKAQKSIGVPGIDNLLDTSVNLVKVALKQKVCGNRKCPNRDSNGMKEGVELKVCEGCRIVRYCSPKCQKAHWREHRGSCASKTNVKIGKEKSGSFKDPNLEID